MALTITITPGELARQAALVYQGKTFEVFLVMNATQPIPLTAEDTYAAWKAIEISGNGYAAVSGTVGFGAYNATSNRYEVAPIVASFGASGGDISFDTVCVKVGAGDYLHSLQVEDPAITVEDGGSRTYLISLVQDD
jgi:hypothetical protein